MASSNKVALVTGANKGIGLETAKGLAAKGYTVYLGSRDLSLGEKALAIIAADSSLAKRIRPLKLDVSSPQSIKEARSGIEGDFGKLDVLVNNAAVGPSEYATDATSVAEIYQKAFATNVIGPAALIEEFKDLLAKSDQPRIVNVSSRVSSFALLVSMTEGPMVETNSKAPQYAASKAALNILTIAFAHKLKQLNPNFKVNSVCPGVVATDMADPAFGEGKPASDGAIAALKYATLLEDGPTGTFYAEPDALGPAQF